jgi:hypothetical protein
MDTVRKSTHESSPKFQCHCQYGTVNTVFKIIKNKQLETTYYPK